MSNRYTIEIMALFDRIAGSRHTLSVYHNLDAIGIAAFAWRGQFHWLKILA